MSWSLLEIVVAIGVFVVGSVFVTAFRYALKDATRDFTPPDPSRDAHTTELPRAELYFGRRGHRVEQECASARTPGKAGTPERLDNDDEWHRGAGKQRMLRTVNTVQATFVAVGITSVFVMFLCLAAVITLMITNAW